MNGSHFSYFTDQVTGFDSERSELSKLAQSSVKWRWICVATLNLFPLTAKMPIQWIRAIASVNIFPLPSML